MAVGYSSLAIGLLTLGALIAAGNLGGTVTALVRQRRGDTGGYSSIPLLSLTFCGLAWLLARDFLGLWPLLPIVLDPANLSLLYLPIYLLRRAARARSQEPDHGADAPPVVPRKVDGLTGLPLRRQIDSAGAERPGVFFDIDDLVRVNDRYGIVSGDHVIVKTARTIEAAAGARGAPAYRVGGDEFLVLLSPSMPRDEVAAFVRDVLETLRASEMMLPEGIAEAERVRLTASAVMFVMTPAAAERFGEVQEWLESELGERASRMEHSERIIDATARTPDWADAEA